MSERAQWVLVLCVSAASLVGCLEPNPYLGLSPETGGDPSGSDTSGAETSGDGTTGEPPACPDPDLCLSLEQLEFSLQGNETFSAEIPKPASAATTAPIAAVRRYQPGQSETLGWSVVWTESPSSWSVEITSAGASPNSRVSGVAAVLGFGAGLPAPTIRELSVATSDGCAQLPIAAGDGELVLDTIETYAPADAPVFEWSRTEVLDAGELTAIEYCVSQPEQLEASLAVKLVSFDLPGNALAATVATPLDGDGRSDAQDSFADFGDASEVVHLIGARALTEASEPKLGWQFDCAATPAFACSYALLDPAPGVRVEVGGAALAIQ